MIRKTLNLSLILLLMIQTASFAQKIAERPLGEFNSIKITGQITAILYPGDENKIQIESEDVEVEKITTEIVDKELKVKLLSHLFKDPTVYAKITFKDIDEITALADAEINFKDPVIKKNFRIKSTSGANIELDIDSRYLKIDAFQGGQVLIKGETDSLDAYVNTGGILSGTDLVCKRAEIRMNTGGKGEITVKEMLEASINTGANFSYYGKPGIKDVSTSLGGNVSAWDEDSNDK